MEGYSVNSRGARSGVAAEDALNWEKLFAQRLDLALLHLLADVGDLGEEAGLLGSGGRERISFSSSVVCMAVGKEALSRQFKSRGLGTRPYPRSGTTARSPHQEREAQKIVHQVSNSLLTNPGNPPWRILLNQLLLSDNVLRSPSVYHHVAEAGRGNAKVGSDERSVVAGWGEDEGSDAMNGVEELMSVHPPPLSPEVCIEGAFKPPPSNCIASAQWHCQQANLDLVASSANHVFVFHTHHALFSGNGIRGPKNQAALI
ncbi:hypothetical protein BDK51DRAFT_45220 [Blyttiomyces helicus]|uniref:Uncharacterized protein n=1 Tax=Blyttiomyces helicus TaxID=388810 RepID=A0A4P9W8Y3_9FUNG|nr:hypothetical protein BDK51DRAFT_45220 [Blyttiomyces helicus]|eukprot:RKO88602.1 hypothetical protein BDK51DRAFT_45220 [Blyttiomyces helicus]